MSSAPTRNLRSAPTHSLRSGDKPREPPKQRSRTKKSPCKLAGATRSSNKNIANAVAGPSTAPTLQSQGEDTSWRHPWWWCIKGYPGIVFLTRDRYRVESVLSMNIGVVFRVDFDGAVAKARELLEVNPDKRLVYALQDGGVQSGQDAAYKAYMKNEKRGTLLCCGRCQTPIKMVVRTCSKQAKGAEWIIS
ncbi:hypothetical protein DFH06DRAFT_1126175 [Mycena polygramma]|nr:hypothetical protein DFH06DRAFT_1126175 [Mycena polygramma]